MTPVGCEVGPPITGQLNLEGIPVLGLVDTGASVTCVGFSVWRQFRTQWGPLKPFEGVVHVAHGKPLQIAGKTQHLILQWGETRKRACFIVIIGLESPPVLIGMDITRPLRVRIDVTHNTATPAQPDQQTIHLNAAQTQDTSPTSCSLLSQAVDMPAETARLVRCHNPWPNENVFFCPEEGLPTFVSGVPALTTVDPKCGSRSTTTARNLFACILGKPWALWRSSPSLTLHRHQPLPAHIARLLSPRTCRLPSSSS